MKRKVLWCDWVSGEAKSLSEFSEFIGVSIGKLISDGLTEPISKTKGSNYRRELRNKNILNSQIGGSLKSRVQ